MSATTTTAPDNGGNNRPTALFDGSWETTSVPIAHKTGFTNTAGLTSQYKGSLIDTITPTDSDSASVEAAYLTIDKAGTPSTGGWGTVVTYTLTYATSQYYTTDNLIVTDTLPDGMSYVDSSASIPPASITPNAGDGTTAIVWNLAALGTVDEGTLTFQAVVNTSWDSPAISGEPIRAGDSMTNHVELAADWHDQINDRDGTDTSIAEASAGLNTGLPSISKEVWDPETSTWTDTIEAQVGDELEYRVRLNVNDTQRPIRDNIALGYITLTDWLPPGTSYNGDAVPSYDATFSVPATGTPPTINADTPNNVSIGSLQGLEWFLGDVSADGWWETTFTVTVQDVPQVTEGLKTGNHWKLTGINTSGREYSDRDYAALTYVEPDLTLVKDAVTIPDPLIPGSIVGYTVTIDNSGMGVAEDVLVTDTLPPGMRSTAPAITAIALDGTPLVEGVDFSASYVGGTGVWTIDLHDGAIDTPIDPGSQLVISYDSVLDSDVAAGDALIDIATVSYDTQADGSGRAVAGTSNVADPNTDDATIQLAPLGIISKTATPAAITVGDTVHYEITVTVPRGMVAYWPRLYDRVTRDGLWFVPGSTTLSHSGTPVSPAALENTATAPLRIPTTNTSRTEFQFDFANPIDNRGQATDYTFVLGYDMIYTGVRDNGTQELFLPVASPSNDILRNDYVIAYWHLTDPGSRPPTYNRNVQYDTNADVDVNQPLITTTKAVTSAGPYAGGSTVQYRVYLDNSSTRSQSTAHDIFWNDTLPAFLVNPTLTGVTRRVSGVTSSIIASVTPDFGSTPVVDIDFDTISLAKGDRITITYTAQVDPEVPANTVLTNRADADWSSLPGSPAGSRRYDDPSWEENAPWTADTSAATVNVAAPTIVKSITGPTPARIGDAVTYNLRVTVPAETILPGSFLSDTIARDGLTYVMGSAATALVSGSPDTSATLAGVVENDTPNPGSTLTFNLTGDIDNADEATTDGDTPYVFDLTYQMVYDGTTDAGGWDFFVPTGSDQAGDTARVHWTVGLTPQSRSSAATLDVDQPLLRLNKSELSTGPYTGGQPVSYRCVIDNSFGFARAYNLSWEDILAADMSDPTLTSVTHSALGNIIGSVTPSSTDDTVTIDFGAVSLGTAETITIEYTAVVDPGAGAGSTQVNTADVDWTSHPSSADKRVYDDSALEAAWTADTDTEPIDVEAAVISKTIEDGDATRTIGEEFEYYVSFSIPASTTAYDMVITDMLPDGLELLYTSPSHAIGVVTTSTAAGVTTIEWDLGDTTNPPYSTLTLTLGVRVNDDYDGGSALSGLPPQDTLMNLAAIDWSTAAVGGVPQHSEDSVTITIQEPHLTIDKAATETALDPGQSVDFDVTIDNDGTSTAYDLQWHDVIPAELQDAGTSPILNSVTLDGSTLNAGSDYVADFSADPTATIDFNVPLGVGQTLLINYTATLDGGVPRGTVLTNEATIFEYRSLPSTATGERVSGPVSDSENVTVRAPEFSITKSLASDPQIQRDQTATWNMVVTNVGNAPAQSVVVTDTLPVGFTYIAGSTSGTLPGGGAYTSDPSVTSTSTLVWDFGMLPLAGGESITFSFATTATPAAPLGTATNAAEVDGEDTTGAPVDPDSDDATALVTDPRLSIDKHLLAATDEHIQVGQLTFLEMIITNTGSTAVDSIDVVDIYDFAYLQPVGGTHGFDSSVPGVISITDVTYGVALPPGNSTTVVIVYRATAHPPSGLTTDTATVSGTDVYGDPVVPDTDSAVTNITDPQVTVTKSLAASQAATVSAGETVDYTIAVQNSGDTTLTSVAIRDTYDTGVFEFVSATPVPDSTGLGQLDWNDITSTFGDLAPSQVVTLTVTMRGRNAAVDSVNTAAAIAGTDINNDPAVLDSDTAIATVVEPLLTIDKSASRTDMAPGDVATYTVTLDNTGTGPAHDVTLDDTVPAGLWSPTIALVEIDGAALTPGSDWTVDWSSPTVMAIDLLVPLDAGSTLTVVYTAQLAGGTPGATALTNLAVAEYSSLPGIDPDENTYGPISDSTTITSQAPSLSVTKTVVGDTELQRGETATYRVTIANTGDAAAYSVAATDTLPAGLTYAAGSSTAAWSGGGSSAMNPAVSGSTLVWTWPASVIEPGESLVLDFQATVDAGSDLETKTNTVTSDAEDGGGSRIAPDSNSAALRVTEPGVHVRKSLAAGQDPFIQVGETVTFDYVVDNSGDTTVAVLPLHETFESAYLSYGSATPVSPDTIGAGTLHWNDITTYFGDIGPGRVETLTVTFTAVSHPPTSSSADTITIQGATDEFGDPVPDTSDTEAISITAPGLSVDKRLGAGQPGQLRLGETTTFDIVVTNTGDTALTHVPLADTYDNTLLEFVSASPSVDTTGVGTLGWSDVTAALGDIAVGDSATVTVTFRALATTVGDTNDAAVAGALDVNNDAVPGDGDSQAYSIVAPVLETSKTAGVSTLGPGESTNYTVDITNTGDGTAYDVTWQDSIPAWLSDPGTSPTLFAVSLDGSTLTSGVHYTPDFSSATTVTIDFFGVAIPAGSTLRIVYIVTLEGGHPSGVTLTNDATVAEYSSLPGADPFETVFGPVSASDDIVTRAPALALDKSVIGDREVQVGQIIDYRVTLTNTGDAPAYELVITDTLPAGFGYDVSSGLATYSTGTTLAIDPAISGQTLTWDMGALSTLPAGESLTIDFGAEVLATAPLTTATNAARGDALDGGDVPLTPPTDSDDVLVTDPSVAIDKHLASGQDEHVQVGEDVTFEIVVTNDGSTVLDVVPLADTWDPTYLELTSATPSFDTTAVGSVSWSDLTQSGTLGMGASITVSLTFRVIAQPIDRETVNTADVIGAVDEYSDPTQDVQGTEGIAITNPQVSVTKVLAAGQDSILALGETVTYEIGVANSGDTTLTMLPLTDTFDSSALAFVSAVPVPSSAGTSTLVWNDLTSIYGDFAPGHAETITAQFEVTGTGRSVTNTATIPPTAIDVWGDSPAGDEATATIGTYDPGNVVLTKTADPPAGTIVLPGDTISYTIAFENNTAVDFPSTFIHDELTDAMEYVAGSLTVTRSSITTGLTDIADADAGTHDPEPPGMVFWDLGTLLAGESGSVGFQVRVAPEELSRRGVRNVADMTTDGDDLAVTGPVDHPVDPFDIIKTGEDVNGGRLVPGDDILWTITVTNTGLTPTTNVVIEDTVPTGTTFVAGSMTGPGADPSAAPNLVWNIGTMQVDQFVTVTFRSRVNEGLPAGSQIRNQALVRSDQSTAKYSDAPETSELGDATLLQTGYNDWIWLGLALAAILTGSATVARGRRKNRHARRRVRTA